MWLCAYGCVSCGEWRESAARSAYIMRVPSGWYWIHPAAINNHCIFFYNCNSIVHNYTLNSHNNITGRDAAQAAAAEHGRENADAICFTCATARTRTHSRLHLRSRFTLLPSHHLASFSSPHLALSATRGCPIQARSTSYLARAHFYAELTLRAVRHGSCLLSCVLSGSRHRYCREHRGGHRNDDAQRRQRGTLHSRTGDASLQQIRELRRTARMLATTGSTAWMALTRSLSIDRAHVQFQLYHMCITRLPNGIATEPPSPPLNSNSTKRRRRPFGSDAEAAAVSVVVVAALPCLAQQPRAVPLRRE